jgi:tetratricopeptide (TPR) repeat protein
MRFFVSLLAVLLLAACQRAAPPAAPLIEGLGSHSMPITTRAPQAQRYFDQGLTLAWAFDFYEATRAFDAALKADPDCALCTWGLAYALGPNINQPFRDNLGPAIGYTQRALQLAPRATPREQALIRTLAVRYGVTVETLALPVDDPKSVPPAALCLTRPPGSDIDPLDLAYANALAQVAAQYPDDLDIALLHAEALLQLAPWDWWDKAGQPRPGTREAIAILEPLLAHAPEHGAANHYLIHALERSPTPERARAAADRLGALAPVASHWVHMPAHIYVRLGDYAAASRANQAAIEADAQLAAQLKAQGFAPLSHVSHHQHYLWSSATLEGRRATALAAAQAVAVEAAGGGEPFGAGGSNDYFLALPLLAQVRFAQWDEVLAAPAPGGRSTFRTAIWHWARGTALARRGDAAGAATELAALQAAAADPALQDKTLKGIDPLTALLALGIESLHGEIALARKQYPQAITHLQRAVELQAALDAHEPPPWPQSLNLELGAALLAAGRPAEAERAFRTDLKEFPANGWALYGLAESLRRQGQRAAAARAAEDYERAWAAADFERPDLRY